MSKTWLRDRIAWLHRGSVKLFKDLFYGPRNENLDLARVTAGLFAGLCAFSIYWNAVQMDKEIDLTAAFTGLAAVATSLGALIAVKDYVKSKFNDDKGEGE